MQISSFSHIEIEYHKATKTVYEGLDPDIDSFHIIGVNRSVSPDGKNTMIQEFGLAAYDNKADAEITANKIADALGIDYIGIK